jgi:LysM repeat protein
MGYWGLRPLIFAMFISVWVVGCSITTDAAPTMPPTQYPHVTLTLRQPASSTPQSTPMTLMVSTLSPASTAEASLTPVVHTVQSGDTLLGIAIQYGVDLGVLQAANGGIDPRSLQIGQQLVIPHSASGAIVEELTPTPLPLPLESPTCYETSTETLLCLGQVNNTLDQPVERIGLVVQLVQSDGTQLAEMETATEQIVIPSGQTAPYRAVFADGWQSYAGVTAVLQSADPAHQVNERFISPVIEDEQGALNSGRYVVSAMVRNPDQETADEMRLVVTLLNDSQQVVGYRVVQMDDSLPGGASLPIRVEVIPQTDDATLTHTLYVEAWRRT